MPAREALTLGLVEKALMLVYPMDNTIVRPMAVRPYNNQADNCNIRTIVDHRGFFNTPQGPGHTLTNIVPRALKA